MLKGCAKYGDGWKPVCDDVNCIGGSVLNIRKAKEEDKSIYLGQYFGHCLEGSLGCVHLTNAYTWKLLDEGDMRVSPFPDGLKEYINKFTEDNMCYYTGETYTTGDWVNGDYKTTVHPGRAVCGQTEKYVASPSDKYEHGYQYKKFMCARIVGNWDDNKSLEYKRWDV